MIECQIGRLVVRTDDTTVLLDAGIGPFDNFAFTHLHLDHTGWLVRDEQRQRALLLGDAIACPVQLEQSDWQAISDVDPALAVRTREARSGGVRPSAGREASPKAMPMIRRDRGPRGPRGDRCRGAW